MLLASKPGLPPPCTTGPIRPIGRIARGPAAPPASALSRRPKSSSLRHECKPPKRRNHPRPRRLRHGRGDPTKDIPGTFIPTIRHASRPAVLSYACPGDHPRRRHPRRNSPVSKRIEARTMETPHTARMSDTAASHYFCRRRDATPPESPSPAKPSTTASPWPAASPDSAKGATPHAPHQQRDRGPGPR